MSDDGLSQRQRLLAAGKLAGLSHHFGLTPADIDQMTGWEIDHYEAALDQADAEVERARERAEQTRDGGRG